MSITARLAVPVLAALLLSHCASSPEEEAPLGQPMLEKLEHAKLDPGPEDADGKPLEVMPSTGLAPVSGKDGRFVIRDPKGALRVKGSLKGGRMDGPWQYFDPSGRRLAEVAYRGDQRHGPVAIFFVSQDGKAAGRKKMTAAYEEGTLHGFAKNWYPGGGQYLEREFDHGILQGSRGWLEEGTVMTDGAAQSAALEVSRSEDALLAELEAFVQLKIRQHATEKTGEPAGKP